ncbi:hypothetical protein M8J77_010840 [Diaphorina citri]|nr:hypothetical protein M8J77_010840 [Diaphorina citri]
MLVSEQHNFISCFVDGSIIEGIDWFMVEKTMINGLEVGRRKISPCNSDVVLPPHGELILVMRMSGEVSTVPAPVNIGGAAVRRRFKRLSGLFALLRTFIKGLKEPLGMKPPLSFIRKLPNMSTYIRATSHPSHDNESLNKFMTEVNKLCTETELLLTLRC